VLARMVTLSSAARRVPRNRADFFQALATGKQSLIEEMIPSGRRQCSSRGAGIEMSKN
jgi:hypothetical protein